MSSSPTPNTSTATPDRPVPPIINVKTIHLIHRVDETIVLPCVAYSSPPAAYQWRSHPNGADAASPPPFERHSTANLHPMNNDDHLRRQQQQQPFGAVGRLSTATATVAARGAHTAATLVAPTAGGTVLATGGRVRVFNGTLSIVALRQSDAGLYVCEALNAMGVEQLVVRLVVVAPLTAHVQPAHQTTDLGKAADFVSILHPMRPAGSSMPERM